jgi:hypothetical protein
MFLLIGYLLGAKWLMVDGKAAISADCCCNCPYGVELLAEFHVERVGSGGCNWTWDYLGYPTETADRQWEITATDSTGGNIHVIITIPLDNPVAYDVVLTNDNACDADGQTFTEFDHAWVGDGYTGGTEVLKDLTSVDPFTEGTYRLTLNCRSSSSSQ